MIARKAVYLHARAGGIERKCYCRWVPERESIKNIGTTKRFGSFNILQFQYVYLFSEGDGLLSIFHIKRNVPPWSAGLATRSVVGFVGAKVRLLFGIANLF